MTAMMGGQPTSLRHQEDAITEGSYQSVTTASTVLLYTGDLNSLLLYLYVLFVALDTPPPARLGGSNQWLWSLRNKNLKIYIINMILSKLQLTDF